MPGEFGSVVAGAFPIPASNFSNYFFMATCLSSCTGEITRMTLADCTPLLAPGGIRAHGVMKCNVEFGDVSGETIEEVAAWEAFIGSGDIVISGFVVGSKAAGTDTNLRVASCLPEVKVGSNKVITIRDYNSASDLTDYDMYSAMENYAGFHWFYITCDDKVYFYDVGTWVSSIDDVRGETREEPVFFQATITTNLIGMKKPVIVPGITSII